MKIVLDTNVLIAAYISTGLCSEILEICLKNHEIVLSDFILDELEKKLIHKFHQPIDEVKQYLTILLFHAERVEAAALQKSICRDPNDDLILATALGGGVSHIVTGDKDMLVLKRYKKISIISPRMAWETIFN